MQRLMTCTALLAALIVLAVARERMTRAGDDIVTVEGPYGKVLYGPAEFSGWEIEPLRQGLLKNLAQRIESMSDEEKQNALESTFAQVRDLEAQQNLDQITVALKAVVKNYDGTRSAETAKRMLELHDKPGSWLPTADPLPPYAPPSPVHPAPPVPLSTVPFTR